MRLKSSVCEPHYYDSMVAKVLAEGKRLHLAMASQEGVIVSCRLKEAGVQSCEPTNRKIAALSRKGPWHLARTLAAQTGMTNKWLYGQGLISVKEQWVKIHYPATAR